MIIVLFIITRKGLQRNCKGIWIILYIINFANDFYGTFVLYIIFL